MANSVTFLHLADLHIGISISRFDRQVSKKIQEARTAALDHALMLAEKKNAEFIIIAGDLFDGERPSFNDASRIFSNLQKKPFKVFILPGNHDPFRPGAVWNRSPWDKWPGTSIHLMSETKPIEAKDGVTLYPCPVTQKSSFMDPTEWINFDGKDHETIRIGIAHGSVMDRENLPPDDHPIPLNCPELRGLDYLALGHWHNTKIYTDKEKSPRMAYSGTLEQMNFNNPKFSIGWQALSPNPDREEFLGASTGKALLVKIEKFKDGSKVNIEEQNVGQLKWVWESYDDVDDLKLKTIFKDLANRQDQLKTLLQLEMKGILSGAMLVELENFEEMLSGRYLHYGLDRKSLHIKPSDEELQRTIGDGVMKQVLVKLKEMQEKAPPGSSEENVIESAMLNLYKIAKEAGK